MRLRDLLMRAVKPRLHSKFGQITLSAYAEDEDQAIGLLSEPSYELTSVSGLPLLIHYRGTDGQESQRLITCKSISDRVGTRYLTAYCHARNAVRSFRLDRIVDLFDPSTGEALGGVQDYFDQFKSDRIAESGLSWGLSVNRRADMVALLNALVFLARCDRDYHPAEHAVLEQALTGFWLKLELPGDPDFDDILQYARKLSPDGETFWLAMNRFRGDARLASLFKSNACLLVEADHVVRQEEAYWLLEIQDFLESN